MRPLFVAAVLVTAAAAPLHAQTKEPRRPKLAAAADTNDPQAYYNYAVKNMERDPERSADALYWATRLNPLYADAYYARRIALLLSKRNQLLGYWQDDERVINSPEIRSIDSLYYRALTIDPFVSQTLELQLFDGVLNEIAKDVGFSVGANPAAVREVMESYLRTAPPALKAWRAYGEGRFGEAVELYGKAISQAKRKASLRVYRGRIYYQMAKVDSALLEFNNALVDLRKQDAKQLVYLYESKALLEHSVGMMYLQADMIDSAKAAFGRALEEDLSFHPAHLQLALLALQTNDTTTALSEMELSSQLRADDPGIHFIYGFTLAGFGLNEEAEVELKKAIQLNPLFSAPYLTLGQVLERMNKRPEAVESYKKFLGFTALGDGRRKEATEALEALSNAKQ
jgi:tetratricopeptide (TPR) repeat protein